MKKALNNLTIAIGIVLICASLFGYGLDKFGYVDIPNDKLPFIIIVIGIGIIVGGVCDVFVKSEKEIKKNLKLKLTMKEMLVLTELQSLLLFPFLSSLPM